MPGVWGGERAPQTNGSREGKILLKGKKFRKVPTELSCVERNSILVLWERGHKT